jgi:hypothetical protein
VTPPHRARLRRRRATPVSPIPWGDEPGGRRKPLYGPRGASERIVDRVLVAGLLVYAGYVLGMVALLVAEAC